MFICSTVCLVAISTPQTSSVLVIYVKHNKFPSEVKIVKIKISESGNNETKSSKVNFQMPVVSQQENVAIVDAIANIITFCLIN